MFNLNDNLKNKKILIYGYGKSGEASFKYLKKNNKISIYDDHKKITKFNISFKNIKLSEFDYIILSPGIDINKCKLKNYLRKNRKKIVTDLDIFYLNNPKNLKITITGTNGKSTTAKLLFKILKDQNKDVKLIGNIGIPVLSRNKIKSSTIFVIEASSYQIDYSQYFKSKYSVILNLNPDHLERHGTFKNYVNAKFKIIKSQTKNDYTFIDSENKILNELVKKRKIKSKVIKIDYLEYKKYFRLIDNIYFKNSSNRKNLSFIFNIAKVLKINFKTVINTANKFKGLDFRQQIIYQSRKLLIINDSKSTSFSSSVPLLESYKNIYWILGGLAKKGDKFKLNKKYFSNIKAFVYGKDRNLLINSLPSKIFCQSSLTLKKILKNLKNNIKNDDSKKVILFSPSAASFDQFKNFEERGKFFNKNIKYVIKKVKT